MGFFDLFSGKDDTPPAPEKRVIPAWAENIKDPLEGWIATQVFVDKNKKKNDRIYYVAELNGDTWDIVKYSYNLNEQNGINRYSSKMVACKGETEAAIRLMADIEKALLEEGYAPVANLRGNYREAANLIGGYIDDKGNYIAVAKDKPLAKDAVFSRKGISAMYTKAADTTAGTQDAVKTWDDFYRVIVNKYPQEEIVLSDQDKQDPRFPRAMEYMAGTLMLMRALEGKMINEEEIERAMPSLSSGGGDDRFNSVGYMKSYWIPSSSGGIETRHEFQPTEWHKLAYICDASRLIAMMRMGSKVYQQFTADISIDTDGLQLLEGISQNISAFAEERLYYSPEQAKQLANVIMQGPDPYADKPLPLEIFYKQYQEQVAAPVSKKNQPKPPAPG